MMTARMMMERCSVLKWPNLRANVRRSIGGININISVNKMQRFRPISIPFSSRREASEGIEPPTCQKQLHKAEIYTTLQQKVTAELEVKRSKFIAVAAPISDEKTAFGFLSEVQDPRATHNCWAYKVGEHYRFNDDGEPGGTAGRPIHSAIVSSGLDRVMVVVMRYFGGVKLGTGGLVRAYGGVTSDCLRDAPICVVKTKVALVLEVPYDLLGNIYHLLQSHQVANLRHEYDVTGDGINYIRFEVDFDKMEILEQDVKSSCSGHVKLLRI